MSNSISIVGNIGRDAEVKNVGSSTVCEFSVGCSTGWGDKKVTSWYKCGLWGSRADKLSASLVKGTKVFVTGELTARTYTNKDGVEKTSLDVNINNVEFVSKSSEGNSRPAQVVEPRTERAESGPEEGDLPF